jgi:hypothetical protein
MRTQGMEGRAIPLASPTVLRRLVTGRLLRVRQTPGRDEG